MDPPENESTSPTKLTMDVVEDINQGMDAGEEQLPEENREDPLEPVDETERTLGESDNKADDEVIEEPRIAADLLSPADESEKTLDESGNKADGEVVEEADMQKEKTNFEEANVEETPTNVQETNVGETPTVAADENAVPEIQIEQTPKGRRTGRKRKLVFADMEITKRPTPKKSQEQQTKTPTPKNTRKSPRGRQATKKTTPNQGGRRKTRSTPVEPFVPTVQSIAFALFM